MIIVYHSLLRAKLLLNSRGWYSSSQYSSVCMVCAGCVPSPVTVVEFDARRSSKLIQLPLKAIPRFRITCGPAQSRPVQAASSTGSTTSSKQQATLDQLQAASSKQQATLDQLQCRGRQQGARGCRGRQQGARGCRGSQQGARGCRGNQQGARGCSGRQQGAARPVYVLLPVHRVLPHLCNP